MGKDVEEAKLICGGQESLVDIKFHSPRELRYPAVFIASNSDIFDNDQFSPVFSGKRMV